MTASTERTNHLAHESSPYLRQHARNPVDWYPWGAEALDRARQLDRPIFLSIGYSACHWCHVMEHESFENAEVARLLNEHFVPIKVDREERPDLDQIYMTAVQLMTGHGGWPMSVFLTPDLRPFFGGTYFPPEDRYNLPGFKRVLAYLIEVWRTQRDQANEQAASLTQHLQLAGSIEAGDGRLDVEVLRQAVAQLERRFDAIHGGFGAPPKFLHTMDLRVLLRAWKRFDLPNALHMVRHTLDKMALGGLFDQLGGGFARYSTDARWLVPHFEKMLYDNALLTTVYLEAFQATGEPFYREVVEQTLGWVEREMTSPEGPFYSALDADSEGKEGKFYVWSAHEIEQILGKDEADLFNVVHGVEPEGNWEETNILHRQQSYEQYSRRLNVPLEELRRRLEEARRKLFEVRSKRVPPGRDDKMLTAWNGLMIAALAQAAQVLDQSRYAVLAARAADFIVTKMRGPDGRLLRTFSSGGTPKLNAYLEDYAYLIDGLVELYEATFEPRWIVTALELAGVMIEQFWDTEQGGFFFTGKDHESLIARTKDPHDNATPSGNALAVTGLLRLVKLTGRLDLYEKAEATLRLYRRVMNQHPTAVSQMVLALDYHLGPVKEFAIVGDPLAPETRQVLRLLREQFLPHKVVAFRASGETVPEDVLTLLQAKISLGGNVTTYVCENFSCQEPCLGAASLAHALRADGS